MSIVVEGHSAHFMVFWDGVGAKTGADDLLGSPQRRPFAARVPGPHLPRAPEDRGRHFSRSTSIGLSNTKQGGGPNGIRAVVGQDLTFAIRGVAIRP